MRLGWAVTIAEIANADYVIDEKECKEEKKLDDKTEESGDIFGGTTANYQTIQVETDESNCGILSLRWPVDHETTCGLCETSFTTIWPN